MVPGHLSLYPNMNTKPVLATSHQQKATMAAETARHQSLTFWVDTNYTQSSETKPKPWFMVLSCKFKR